MIRGPTGTASFAERFRAWSNSEIGTSRLLPGAQKISGRCLDAHPIGSLAEPR
jgi:hypothetical protein